MAAARFSPVRFGPMLTVRGSHPGCAVTTDVVKHDASVRNAENVRRSLGLSLSPVAPGRLAFDGYPV
jgi:hypothetical protein